MIRVMLFDLDGVLRHFDPADAARIEAAHGLPPGTLARRAFDPALLLPAIRGETPRREWIRRLGADLGSPAAASAFLGLRGRVDPEVLALVDGLREQDLRVGLLTNATDSLADELAALGVDDRFDVIFNSSELGHVKPEPGLYARVLDALGVLPEHVGFTDDGAANVEAATSAGWRAVQFTGADALASTLARWTRV